MLLMVDGLTVREAGRAILEGVSLAADAGEIVGLLGANASGKTTTLRSIMGLCSISHGRVLFDGRNIVGLKPYQIAGLGSAMVPENRRLFPRLTVAENLEVALPAGITRQERAGRLEVVRHYFPILSDSLFCSRLAGTLSGGEQQQVAMARALVVRPRLILLDEPSMGMAVTLVSQNFGILESLARNGTTVILVEQNVRMALSVASRAYVLQGGRVILEGTSAGLLANDMIKRSYLGEFVQ
jgi:branched-chain amino acid transport system ATP-binding protein